jgi:hypothetical protein
VTIKITLLRRVPIEEDQEAHISLVNNGRDFIRITHFVPSTGWEGNSYSLPADALDNLIEGLTDVQRRIS